MLNMWQFYCGCGVSTVVVRGREELRAGSLRQCCFALATFSSWPLVLLLVSSLLPRDEGNDVGGTGRHSTYLSQNKV